MLQALHNSLLSLVYPQECRVCSNQVEDNNYGSACLGCWTSTRIFDGSEMLCDKCGAFFGDKAAPIPVFCRQCDDHYYDKALAIGVYEKALAASIVRLKSVPALPRRIKDLVRASSSLNTFDDADLIMPIPLSRLRRIERGFNQAEIIARILSNRLRLPVDSHSLTRKTHTPMHRIGMDKKARELTVKNAFDVARPKFVAGKNILLVDDVFTSGSTASSCARVLKKNGSVSVRVFSLARAVMN